MRLKCCLVAAATSLFVLSGCPEETTPTVIPDGTINTDATTDAGAETTPTPDATTETTPTPDATAETTPTPDAIPDGTPDAVPDATPDDGPGDGGTADGDGGTTDGGTGDGGTTDGGTTDGGTGDGGTTDGGTTDGGTTDGGTTDGGTTDGGTTDGGTTDGGTTDGGTTDGGTPDGAVDAGPADCAALLDPCTVGGNPGDGFVCVNDGTGTGVCREDCGVDACTSVDDTCFFQANAGNFCAPTACTTFGGAECGAGAQCLVLADGSGVCASNGYGAAGTTCFGQLQCDSGLLCLNNECVAPQCTSDGAQACADAGDVCTPVDFNADTLLHGFCDTPCTPFQGGDGAGGCDVGEWCFPSTDDIANGLCVPTGTGSAGDACGAVPLEPVQDCCGDSCGDQTILDCVCAEDDYCCNVEYDVICVGIAEDTCGAGPCTEDIECGAGLGCNADVCEELCDPAGAACSAGICIDTGVAFGVCDPSGCTPFTAGACPAGQWCQPTNAEATEGTCTDDGTANPGEACGFVATEPAPDCCGDTCTDQAIIDCTNPLDGFCDVGSWDSICASVAQDNCGLTCGVTTACVADNICNANDVCETICSTSAGSGELGACAAGLCVGAGGGNWGFCNVDGCVAFTSDPLCTGNEWCVPSDEDASTGTCQDAGTAAEGEFCGLEPTVPTPDCCGDTCTDQTIIDCTALLDGFCATDWDNICAGVAQDNCSLSCGTPVDCQADLLCANEVCTPIANFCNVEDPALATGEPGACGAGTDCLSFAGGDLGECYEPCDVENPTCTDTTQACQAAEVFGLPADYCTNPSDDFATFPLNIGDACAPELDLFFCASGAFCYDPAGGTSPSCLQYCVPDATNPLGGPHPMCAAGTTCQDEGFTDIGVCLP